MKTNPLERLQYHVTGAIERGETEPIIEQPAPNKAQHSPLRQVTVAEYGTFFALKNGSETLATSAIREPLDALAHAYNHADKLAEALRELRDFVINIIEENAEPNLEQCVDARETANAALAAYEEAQ